MDAATIQAAAAWATLLFAPVAYYLRTQHTEIAKLRERLSDSASKEDVDALTKALAELRETLASLGTWRSGHEKQDDAVHSRLEGLVREALAEIRLNRTEQGEQHSTMRAKIDEAIRDGAAGRREIHKQIGELNTITQQLVGAERARQERGDSP